MLQAARLLSASAGWFVTERPPCVRRDAALVTGLPLHLLIERLCIERSDSRRNAGKNRQSDEDISNRLHDRPPLFSG